LGDACAVDNGRENCFRPTYPSELHELLPKSQL
jgi:hypothetical protein